MNGRMYDLVTSVDGGNFRVIHSTLDVDVTTAMRDATNRYCSIGWRLESRDDLDAPTLVLFSRGLRRLVLVAAIRENE